MSKSLPCHSVRLVFTTAIIGTLALRASAQEYAVSRIVPPPGIRDLEPIRINDVGETLCMHYVAGRMRAFVYERGQLTELGTFMPETLAFDLNDAGHVVGCGYNRDTRAVNGFVWRDGEFELLDGLPGAERSLAMGINDAGAVVGMSEDVVAGEARAVLWDTDGRVHSLGTLPGGGSSWAELINSAGQVAGRARNADGERCNFFYEDGVMVELDPFGQGSMEVRDINERGQVCGTARLSESEIHAYVFHEGVYQDLAAPDSGFSGARGINNFGHTVGQARFPEHDPDDLRACIWRDGAIIDLIDLVPDGIAWVSLFLANDINDQGQIVGLGALPGYLPSGFLLTPLDTCFGDLNEDGTIDLTDLAHLLANYGKQSAVYEDGDLDADGEVALSDLAWLVSLCQTECD